MYLFNSIQHSNPLLDFILLFFFFSFKLPGSSTGFQITVEDCEPECNLTLTSVSNGGQPKTVFCNETLDCVLDVVSPSLQTKQRVSIWSHITSNVTFVVTVSGTYKSLTSDHIFRDN